MQKSIIISLFLILFTCIGCISQKAAIQQTEVSEAQDLEFDLTKATLFKKTLEAVIAEVDCKIESGIDVPVPKDMAGGYTHERHKRNFFLLQKAGDIYQITKDEKYAQYIKESFMAYAELFPTLPKHPTDRSYSTGKIFWQCLNDANWVVYCSQAYRSIYDWLSEEDKSYLEKNLFRPIADWLSIENPQFFNRIHNHSTWANAAVGMIGLVMQDDELVKRALYGLTADQLDESMVDNDGGYIIEEGKRQAGFLAQLDYSFSPDGHFTEGPYYLRYAMTPFLLFATYLDDYRPELEIYNYRDGILKKSIYALLYETDARGQFFPINDAQKGMSWLAREVVAAVDIGYGELGKNPMLLSIAKLQDRVLLNKNGYKVSQDIDKGMTVPFKHKSMVYRDGANGDRGGLGIIRSRNDQSDEICIVLKYAAHGMGHGHFDRLSYSLYDNEGEVIQDYGAARWVNIDQKGGGRYLPENHSFAKHSIVHNSVVVDQKSHYKGKVKDAEAQSAELYFYDFDDADNQVISAKENHAYDDVTMHRTMILMNDSEFRKPIVVDIYRIESEQTHTYDFPTWYMGHFLSADFEIETNTSGLAPMGTEFGYEHLWHEASAKPKDSNIQFTWFGNQQFYTLTSTTEDGDEMIMARGGANDPNFNLRHDPVMILRRSNKASTTRVSIIESHGTYDPVSEIPINPFSSITSVEVVHDDKDYTVIEFSDSKNSLESPSL